MFQTYPAGLCSVKRFIWTFEQHNIFAHPTDYLQQPVKIQILRCFCAIWLADQSFISQPAPLQETQNRFCSAGYSIHLLANAFVESLLNSTGPWHEECSSTCSPFRGRRTGLTWKKMDWFLFSLIDFKMNFWVSGHQFGFIVGGIGRASNRESIKKNEN